MIDERELHDKFEALAPYMGELPRRMWAATEARAMGRGGVAAVHPATGHRPGRRSSEVSPISIGCSSAQIQRLDEQRERLLRDQADLFVHELRARLHAMPRTGPGNKGKRQRLKEAVRYGADLTLTRTSWN